MPETFIVYLFLLLILIFLSGFFSAAEIAVVAVKTNRLKELSQEGNRRAQAVLRLKSNPDSFFNVVQIGGSLTTSAASIVAGIIAIVIFAPMLKDMPIKFVSVLAGPLIFIAVVLIMSYLLSLFGELIPRAVAIRKSEPIALWAGPLTWHTLKIFTAYSRFLRVSSNLFLRLFGIRPEITPELSVSEAEVKIIIREGFEKGVLDEAEHKLIRSVFEFTDTTVRRAMTPRTDIIAFEINDSPEVLLKMSTEERFSRYPVYQETIDNIKGIIHSRDLLFVYTHKELFALNDILRTAFFIPDSLTTLELLKDMQKKKYQMAIVLDEFGGTAGLITMEDILEELVGDIQDEYDKELKKIEFVDKYQARVRASMPVDEFANEFGVEVADGDFDTVGGMIVTKLGRIPALNELIRFEGFSLRVSEKEGPRIKILLASKEAAEPPSS